MAAYKRAAATILNVAGTGVLALVILAALSTVLPRWLGYEPYAIVSGSMAPSMPTGSMAYVRACSPEDVSDGDVIAFLDGRGNIVVHRCLRNRVVEGEFLTKGDANDSPDMSPVPYGSLVGLVERHVPVAGFVAEFCTGRSGKIYLISLALCGAMMNAAASRLRGSGNKDGEEE